MIKRIIHKLKHRRFCKLNNYFCPDCIYHDFVFDGSTFRGNRCRYPKDESKCDFYEDKRKKVTPKITNADRIRAMTDEELAYYLNNVETDGRVYGPQGEAYWLDWLRQEATP